MAAALERLKTSVKTVAFFAVVALLLFYLSFAFTYPRKTKLRAQRIQNVNRISQLSFTLTNISVSNLDTFPVTKRGE